MKVETLLSPRFEGERFRAHTLPLALVKDLEALQGIILEIARAEFINTNPDRQRLPRGFSDSLTLHLAGTEPGSVAVSIALLVTGSALFPGFERELNAARSARDTYLSAVAAAHNDRPAPILPKAAWPYIERFGRGLRDGETIDLGSLEGQRVELTKEVRRRLLLTRAEVQAISDEVQLIARLGDVRPKERVITLDLADERRVSANVTVQQLQDLNEVRVADFGSAWLRIEGIGSFDRDEQLRQVSEVHTIELLDSLDPRAQLEKLKRLRPGWLDGEDGRALDHSLLDRIRALLDEHLVDEAPLPRLYATPEGGVEAEWLIGRLDLSIEFDPVDLVIEWHALDLDTGQVNHKHFPFDDFQVLGQAMHAFFSDKAVDDGEVAP
ncbi:MAG: hypothetical protein KIT72_08060 [Polyangiaceae bacterium]|nr:hypothetical protein [Polyangiaceae bacterium]MCW5790360.1 hypothetical protein [Polyangiaceae bacterium]